MGLVNWFVGGLAAQLHSLIGILLLGFWIWCVYDCATRRYRDPNKKTIWLVVLIASLPLGLYELVVFAYVLFGREQGYFARY